MPIGCASIGCCTKRRICPADQLRDHPLLIGGDLPPGHQPADRLQGGGVVQRGQGVEVLQLLQHGGIHPGGGTEALTAVHQPVARRLDLRPPGLQ